MSKELSPLNKLVLASFGHIASKCVTIAAEKKLDEILQYEALSIEMLANKLNFTTQATTKFVQVLAAYDVIDYSDTNKVKANEVTNRLKYILSPHIIEAYTAIDDIEETLKGNKTCWETTFGNAFYPSLKNIPGKLEQFEDWCTLTAKDWLPAAYNLYDFTKFVEILDIGGGQGHFLATLLRKKTNSIGILFDQPEVISKANVLIRNEYSDVYERIELVGGNFFEKIPEGKDAYVICRTLLNWSNDDALKIINNCYHAMKQGSKLLIVDFVLPEQNHPSYKRAVLSDINLYAIVNSANRTKSEWLSLINESMFGTNTNYSSTENNDEYSDLIMPLCVIEATKS